MRRTLTALLALITLGLLFNAAPAVQADDKAPDFTLRDLQNKEVTLSELEGKIVLISFWATWCTPCMQELPHVDKLYQEYKDQGFVALAISADDAKSASRVKPTVRSKGWTFPVLLDKQTAVVALYNPQKTLPFTELIGENRQVLWQHQGYTPGDEIEMRHKVEEAIKARDARAQ